MILALFDFDGTITTKDSLADFIQFAVGIPTYYLGLVILSPVLIAYFLNIIPNHFAKETLLAHFFKSWDVDRFKKLADEYGREQIDTIVRPNAMKRIRWHQEQGHKVVIVSASIECWLKRWCEKNNIDLIATRLEIRNSRLTGKFSTRNCYGMEKVNRVKEAYKLSLFAHIYAYGDSSGDKEILALANESFYKPFRE